MRLIFYDFDSILYTECLQKSKPESQDSGFFILGRTERARGRTRVKKPKQ